MTSFHTKNFAFTLCHQKLSIDFKTRYQAFVAKNKTLFWNQTAFWCEIQPMVANHNTLWYERWHTGVRCTLINNVLWEYIIYWFCVKNYPSFGHQSSILVFPKPEEQKLISRYCQLETWLTCFLLPSITFYQEAVILTSTFTRTKS